MSARAGNEIASAFICILNKIASDESHINNIICWSDSCVSEDRNIYHRLYWNFLAVKIKPKASQ